MKNHLMPLLEKVLLRKRFIIESLFDKIKSSMGVEHSRQRSPINALVHALVHILSSMAAYTLAQPKVKMGKVSIPGPVPNLPSLSSPYPELVFYLAPVGHLMWRPHTGGGAAHRLLQGHHGVQVGIRPLPPGEGTGEATILEAICGVGELDALSP